MNPRLRICVDRVLPENRLVRAAARSIAEDPTNVPVVARAPGLGVRRRATRMAVDTPHKWANGRALRVRFMEGDQRIKQKIEDYAHQWSAHCNITFEFGNAADAEIRIAFTPNDGSWSWVGNEALEIPRNEPTMNFGWLTPTTDESEYSRVVLHEFGHALGCIHEHQHPRAGIPWDRAAVYREYSGPPNNWSREEVDANLFDEYDEEKTNFSAFDKRSIMLYAIPNELTLGDYAVGWNRLLSETDKNFIGVTYPKDPKPVQRLELGAEPLRAAIGAHGELDQYELSVPRKLRVTIETRGRTDVVMAVVGPGASTNVVANDDDSGKDRNAKITADLARGTYMVLVRHYRPRGTGKYRISARKAT